MVTQEVSNAYLSLENGKKCVLRYYLVCGAEAKADVEISTYGIAIKLVDQSNNLLDSSIYEDVCTDKLEVLDFIEKLSKGTVTPITLKYHIEDFIAQRCDV